MLLLGTQIQTWIKWKRSITQTSMLVTNQMHFHTISKWNIREKLYSHWRKMRIGTVIENWKDGGTEQKRREEMKSWGCDSLWDHWRSLVKIFTSQRRCLYVSEHVLYMLTLFAVSPVLAGRACLCVALSHHLFLARLLISVLIISCPASLTLSGVHTYIDFILSFVIHPSIHQSITFASQPSIFHLNN